MIDNRDHNALQEPRNTMVWQFSDQGKINCCCPRNISYQAVDWIAPQQNAIRLDPRDGRFAGKALHKQNNSRLGPNGEYEPRVFSLRNRNMRTPLSTVWLRPFLPLFGQ